MVTLRTNVPPVTGQESFAVAPKGNSTPFLNHPRFHATQAAVFHRSQKQAGQFGISVLHRHVNLHAPFWEHDGEEEVQGDGMIFGEPPRHRLALLPLSFLHFAPFAADP